ncbi:hypothetical protein MHH94_09915 [Mammaliicoccus sp. FSL K6-3158]|uniref:hypothetical protein n=1 Tax=Mammaliicoccus sp. FSL K6-3158 TaxID=2921491 RepID=UPI0030F6178F
MANIYLAKLNVNEKIHSVYKGETTIKTFLDQLYIDIDSNRVMEDEMSGVRYKIVDIEKNPNDFVINGKFLRIEKSKTQNTYDEKNDELKEQIVESPADYIAFSFFVHREMIAFVPKQAFSRQHFLKVFADFIYLCSPQIGRVNLQIKLDNKELDKKFAEINTMKKISVVIVPPNSDKDLWKGLESISEELEETEATEMEFSLKASIRKPLVKSSELVKGLYNFVKRGYGEMVAEGKGSDGMPLEINTLKNKELIEKHKIPESIKNSPNEIASEVIDKNIL